MIKLFVWKKSIFRDLFVWKISFFVNLFVWEMSFFGDLFVWIISVLLSLPLRFSALRISKKKLVLQLNIAQFLIAGVSREQLLTQNSKFLIHHW